MSKQRAARVEQVKQLTVGNETFYVTTATLKLYQQKLSDSDKIKVGDIYISQQHKNVMQQVTASSANNVRAEFRKYIFIQPVLTTEKEKVMVGDWAFGASRGLFKIPNQIVYNQICLDGTMGDKVLALPTNFSRKDLRNIAEGKLLNGAKLLIETEYVHDNAKDVDDQEWFNQIKLDISGYITALDDDESITREAKKFARKTMLAPECEFDEETKYYQAFMAGYKHAIGELAHPT